METAVVETQVEFKAVETVKEFIGGKGQFEFLDTNFDNPNALVMITIHPDKKTKKKPLKCFLSTSLSKEMRAKTLTTKQLLGLSYGVGAHGNNYITRPIGNSFIVDVDVKDAIDYEAREINMEELIAL